MQQPSSVIARAQRRDVVAELADLGRGLVDEARARRPGPRTAPDRNSGSAARARRIERARCSALVEIEAVVAHEEVEPGGVAAAHLEPVDRRERDLHRRERLDRAARTRPAASASTSRPARSRSRATAHTASFTRTSAALTRLELVGVDRAVGVEPGLDRAAAAPAASRARRRADPAPAGSSHERPHARHPAEGRVDRLDVGRGLVSRPADRGAPGSAASRWHRGGTPKLGVGQLAQGGRRPVGATADDRDDSAHRRSQSTGVVPRRTVEAPTSRNAGVARPGRRARAVARSARHDRLRPGVRPRSPEDTMAEPSMPAIEAKIRELTLDEKCLVVGGASSWRTHPCARLGVPPIRMSDGPNGVRGEARGRARRLRACSIPVGIALGATWDPDLIGDIGELLGREAVRKGAHVLLAPTVNLQRTPVGGRVFECMSETRALGALAARYVQGVQASDVAVTVKHFVANDTEIDRMSVDARRRERALHELYLRPFEAAVREGGAWGVMSAYNQLEGEHCAQNRHLLTEILRDMWGFDGFVVSDWLGAHDDRRRPARGPRRAMPGPRTVYGDALAEQCAAGAVDESVVDGLVRDVLVLVDRTPPPSARSTGPRSRSTTRRARALPPRGRGRDGAAAQRGPPAARPGVDCQRSR